MNIESPARYYRQTARAEAAAATGRRILDAFVVRAQTGWMDEITLDQVAGDAGVTVQTVIRRFGGKEGLLAAAAGRMTEEIRARRELPADSDWRPHLAAVFADYEVTGPLVLRLLAQEERWPALKPVLAAGRASHRETVERAFGPWLAGVDGRRRAEARAGLLLLTDVYAWRLLRIDQGLSPEAAVALTQRLVGALLDAGGTQHG